MDTNFVSIPYSSIQPKKKVASLELRLTFQVRLCKLDLNPHGVTSDLIRGNGSPKLK